MQDFIKWLDNSPFKPYSSEDIKDSMGESTLIRAFDDKPNSKSLYYSLKQDERGWFGHVYSCKQGAGDIWFSKSDKKWTKEQKAEWDARRKQIREEQNIAKQVKHNEVAYNCAKRYSSLELATTHPYITAKQIAMPAKVKIDGELLVVPAIDFNNKIWTLQEIDTLGVKRFVYCGRKEGTFFPIGLTKDDIPTIIHICEGLATGATLYEALDSPVIVAWDAGNLRAVAKGARDKYPQAKIIICADNDQWTIRNPKPKPLADINGSEIDGDDYRWDVWRDKGYCVNRGVYEAEQAAALCDGYVIYPDLNGLDIRKPTDFNDAKIIFGLDYIKNRLSGVSFSPASTSTAVVATDSLSQYAPAVGDEIIGMDNDMLYGFTEAKAPDIKKRKDGNPDWFSLMIWKEEPREPVTSMMEIADMHDGKSMHNLITFIRNRYKGLFVLNEFSDEIIVRTRPPWMSESEPFKVHTVTDSDKINMAATLEWYGFQVSDKTVEKAIISISEKDKIHPVRNYFEGYTDAHGNKHKGLGDKWDGVPRLDNWLINYAGATTQDEDYVRTVGSKWLMGAVARIYNAGCKFDHMLVLEGKTDIGKSWLFRELATFGKEAKESYFLDDVRLTHLESDKHAAMRWQGKLIIEVAELAGLSKASVETVKAWITRQEDEYMPKFSNERKVRPRQFVLAGTTNEDVWLTDTTGNKRFWPVRVTYINNQAFLNDKDMLWAEAIVRYKEGEQYWLTDDDPVYDKIKHEQMNRLVGDSWADACSVKLSNFDHLSMTDVYDVIQIPITQRNSDTDRRVRGIMRSLGYQWKQAYSVTKHKGNVWVRG